MLLESDVTCKVKIDKDTYQIFDNLKKQKERIDLAIEEGASFSAINIEEGCYNLPLSTETWPASNASLTQSLY